MNLLELFKATVSHENHDEFLCHADFTPELSNRLLEKHGLTTHDELYSFFRMKKWGVLAPETKDGVIPPDFSKYFADMDIADGAFINSLGVLEIPANYYHFTGYVSPLRNAETIKDIEDFPFPLVDNLSFDNLKADVERMHNEQRPAAVFTGHLYENAWQIRGYEEFLGDMLSQPEICECILDRLCECNIRIAEESARAGVDILLSGDDVANQISMMFSPVVWRKFLKSRWAKVYEAAYRIKPDIQVWYHSDGNIMEIIPELIDIGVTILNPVQPECMDVAEVKKKFGSKLVFDGTIGTQTVMPFGTADDVKENVREMKRVAGYDGALILSPTHVLEPEVPLENIEAFFEACNE